MKLRDLKLRDPRHPFPSRLGRVARALIVSLLLVALGLAGCASTGGPGSSSDSGKPSDQDLAQARSHQSIGTSYMRQGRLAQAIRELRAAEKLDPNDGWIQLALAEAYRRKGLIQDAETHLLKALDHDPGFQEARLTLSALYIEMQRYDDAIHQAQMLVDDPTFPLPWAALTNEGYAQLKLGRRVEARKNLELALEYHDHYWRALLNLGILDAQEGKHVDAIRHFKQVIALGPGPLGVAEANYRLGEAYASLGKRDQAVEHLVAAAAQRPSGPWGRRSEDYLKRLR